MSSDATFAATGITDADLEETRRRLHRWCRRLRLPRHEREEIVDQAMLLLIEKAPKLYDPARPAVPFLVSVGIGNAKNAYQRHLRYRRALTRASEDGALPDGLGHRATWSQEDELRLRELQARLRRCFKRAREGDREALDRELGRDEDTQLAEVAASLGLSPQNYRQRLFQARRRLRECIKREEGSDA